MTAHSETGAPPVDIVLGEPELRLRVGDIHVGPAEAAGTMRTGPWCTVDGRPAPGALGVLVDDVLGWLPAQWSPPGTWAMSTELRVEMRGPLPIDGRPIRCIGTSDGPQGRSVLATGAVRDEADNLIATAAMRIFYVSVAPPNPSPIEAGNASDGDLLAQLHGTIGGPGRSMLTLEAGVAQSNPLGVMHGGVGFAATEIAGMSALRAVSPGLITASVQVTYARAMALEGEVQFRAEVIHAGRVSGVARVDGFAADGTRCMIGTVTATYLSAG